MAELRPKIVRLCKVVGGLTGMDAEGPDLKVAVPNGKILKENYLGKDIANYDSMLYPLTYRFLDRFSLKLATAPARDSDICR